MNPDRPHLHSDELDPRNWRERLSSYLDGEMSPEDGRRFLNWLEAHPAALKDAEEARHVWALLSAYADEPVPEGFAERVLAKTTGLGGTSYAGPFPDAVAERAPAWRVLAGGRSRAIAAAAAVLVAVGVGVLATQRRGGPASDSTSSATLEGVPAELLESDNLTSLASLSDEEFDAILSADPDTLTSEASKDHGG